MLNNGSSALGRQVDTLVRMRGDRTLAVPARASLPTLAVCPEGYLRVQ